MTGFPLSVSLYQCCLLLLDLPVTIIRGTKFEYWDLLERKEISFTNVAALRRKVWYRVGHTLLLSARTSQSAAQTVIIENQLALSKPSNSDICVRPENHCFAHYKPPLNYILSQMNPVHILLSYFLQLTELPK